jgi:hypothetical protein
MVWNKNSISLKEEMLVWIEKRTMRQGNRQGGEPNTRIKPTAKTNETGLLFMMTVEELALQKRVKKDLVISVTEMMQELAVILHTTKQYDVSWQNLYNCYFTYDLATIKSLTENFFVMTLHQLEVKLKKKGSKGNY